MPTVSALETEVSAVEGFVDKANQAARKLEGQDRSTIAKRIVLLYIVAVLACFIFIIGIFWLGTPCVGDVASAGCVEWQGPADFLLQVLTTAVLPIVTLVLGYYFGTAKAESEAGE